MYLTHEKPDDDWEKATLSTLVKEAPLLVLTRQPLVLFRASTSTGKHVEGHVFRLYSEKRHIASIHPYSEIKQELRISVQAVQ